VILDTHELAWAAGFFDGEGSSVLAHRKTGWKNCDVQVAQVHREPLDRFDRATGCIGILRGPYPRREGWQPIYLWRTTGLDQCQSIMTMLWPWLCSVKREQWDVVRQAMLVYKQEIVEEHARKRAEHKPGINPVTNDQLEQILRVIEPWRFKE
jgi:hypothetical protein